MRKILKSASLPLLLAVYPILFLYGQNAWLLKLGNLVVPVLATIAVVAVAFLIYYFFQRRWSTASLSSALFLVIFFGYGFLYRGLIRLDRFHVDHLILVPAVLVLAGYLGYFIAKIKPKPARNFQNVLLVISAALVIWNGGLITQVEVQKAATEQKQATLVKKAIPITGDKKLPDVYFIMFDEYAGFDAIQGYWHDTSYTDFDKFLKDNNFFVIPNSANPTLETIDELASRLNMHSYPESTDPAQLHVALNNNKVMQIFKSYGYTTVNINMPFSDVKADVNLIKGEKNVGGLAGEEFNQTFLDDTLFTSVSNLIHDDDQTAIRQRDLIMYAINQTENLKNIPGPKFVYTHILLPHQPFIFDENGNLLPPQDFYDWHYYLGQYKYASKLAQQMITTLLKNADPKNPPIIIFQGDHGARNLTRRTNDNIALTGYLEDYDLRWAHMSLNAMYIPGFDPANYDINMKPVQTFALVINYLFNVSVSAN